MLEYWDNMVESGNMVMTEVATDGPDLCRLYFDNIESADNSLVYLQNRLTVFDKEKGSNNDYQSSIPFNNSQSVKTMDPSTS